MLTYEALIELAQVVPEKRILTRQEKLIAYSYDAFSNISGCDSKCLAFKISQTVDFKISIETIVVILTCGGSKIHDIHRIFKSVTHDIINTAFS